MIVLLNIGRLLMVVWIGYGLLIMFAPQLVHRPPDRFEGAIHVAVAFALGYLLDRAISATHRRRAAREARN